MLLIRELAGRSWSDWPSAEPDDNSGGGSGISSPFTAETVTPSSSRSHSPRPLTPSSVTDVMKLPKKDMHIFGLCPVQDDFVLVVCDFCGSSVKMEAFTSHVKLRHGSKAATVSPSYLSKVEKNLRKCTMGALKDSTSSTSSSSSCKSVDKELAPSLPTSAPAATVLVEQMEVEEIPDSTTPSSNVISIPDTEPLPLDMSGDLMAIMGEPTVDSTTPSVGKINLKIGSDFTEIHPETSPVDNLPQPTPPPNVLQEPPKVAAVKPSPTNSLKKGSGGGGGGCGGLMGAGRDGGGSRKPNREYNPDKHCGVWDTDLKRHCTRALTCKSHSVLLKRKIGGRTKLFDELVAAHKKGQTTVTATAVVSSSASSSAAPTLIRLSMPQSVTPTVSVVVSATATAPLPGTPSSNNVPNAQPTSSPSIAAVAPQQATIIHPNIQINVPPQSVNPNVRKSGLTLASSKDGYVDENLHYTTDHPKPLAVCTFGGRRMGGLLVADRSQFLTRKLVRVAITSNGGITRVGTPSLGGVPGVGFHRIKPRVGGFNLADQPIGLIKGGGIIKRTQSGNLARALQPPSVTNTDGSGSSGFLINYNNLSVKPSIGGVSLSTLQPRLHPSSVLLPTESFKTDIQDFKGGIKFERGGKIKHILPSGSEITKQ